MVEKMIIQMAQQGKVQLFCWNLLFLFENLNLKGESEVNSTTRSLCHS
jgi:hypothetical protein